MSKKKQHRIDMHLRSVGEIRSKIKSPTLTSDDDNLTPEARAAKFRDYYSNAKRITAELIIDPELKGILDGIEGFSHIIVLYWPHLLPPERRKICQVHPMGREDLPLNGVFATCSPARPNPILMTVVRLLGRDDNVLRVTGLDAVDGSPIVDIKPYTGTFYEEEKTTRPDWIDIIHQDLEGESP